MTNMRSVSVRARLREGALTLLAITALVSILYSVDPRVRDTVTGVFTGASPSNVTRVSTQLTAETSKMVRNAHDQAVQNAAITGFVSTAGLLLLFMLKT
jgi:hypothetical protein